MADPAHPIAPPGSSLLVVDDDPSIVASLAERFAARGFSVATAASGREAEPFLRQRPDVVLCDLQMADGGGLHVLDFVRDRELDVTVVMITAHGTVDRAVEAMRRGAWDFVQKPFDGALIEAIVRRALDRGQMVRRERAISPDPDADDAPIAVDPAMTAQLALLRKAAVSDASVLLLGESGTGKEVMAQALHRGSARRDGPFVAINCAALPDGLLESELFGHEKGAFTGADRRRIGRLETAHRGTLFLDEIGDISPAFQTRLLRVLQERQFERVGASETTEVDVRVVAATHRDLRRAVAEGSFREDLYYRLDVVTISIPPLRDRRADILPLAEHFCDALARDAGRGPIPLSDGVRQRLLAHAWPGNIRELRNVIERAIVLCDGEITEADLPPELTEDRDPAERAPAPLEEGFHARVEAFRRQVIVDALRAHGGSRTEAAQALGLQRTYLSRLIRQLGIRE